ncbi:MAG: DUF1614 domain-containing protein [Candidatus Hodarchaeaceae archaeon]|nr:DUF1614 domain-containing protein [Candidatus Hodarchaeaceae archaeon]
MNKGLVHLPLTLPFFLLFILLALLFPLIMSEAFMRLGFSPLAALYFLIFSIFGSAINIPLKTIYTAGEIVRVRVHSFYGLLHPELVREHGRRRTVIAMNVGGALVPILVSSFLFLRFGTALSWRVPLGIALVSAICFKLARIVPRVGIVMPAFIPPLAAAAVAIPLGGTSAPALAYISGVCGVLLGADLLNLREVSKLGAPVMSIGGAGTFDGIFLTGIISVLLV